MKKVFIIYTGGTIGMSKDYHTGSLIPFQLENIYKNIPELQLLGVELSSFSFEKPIDSSDMNIALWTEIAQVIKKNYDLYDGFVVLHGTDTMSYSASAISFMLQGIQKPVIFTGSQLPIGDLRTDAKENLITSIYFASLQENNAPIVQEICIYFEYKLFRANRTTKFSTEHFDAYMSPNYPLLGTSGVTLQIEKEHLLANKNKEFRLETQFKNSIGIFTYFPNCIYSTLRQLVEDEAIEAIILQTFGSGNIPNHEENFEILRKAQTLQKKIIVMSQCIVGKINIGKYQNSNIFKEINAIDGKDMTMESTITKCMYLLGKNLSYQDFKQQYESNLFGELTQNF